MPRRKVSLALYIVAAVLLVAALIYLVLADGEWIGATILVGGAGILTVAAVIVTRRG